MAVLKKDGEPDGSEDTRYGVPLSIEETLDEEQKSALAIVFGLAHPIEFHEEGVAEIMKDNRFSVKPEDLG